MTVEILKYLSERYAQQAEEGPEFDNYIAKRGISLESAKAFKLGITNSENYIINHINTLELEQRVEWVKSCVALGLINNHHGRLNDRFKYRIIFPIINREQTIVGFSTRTYIDSNQPRWINSRIIVRSEKNHNLIGEHLIDDFVPTHVFEPRQSHSGRQPQLHDQAQASHRAFWPSRQTTQQSPRTLLYPEFVWPY